jgi:hypothetical protein
MVSGPIASIAAAKSSAIATSCQCNGHELHRIHDRRLALSRQYFDRWIDDSSDGCLQQRLGRRACIDQHQSVMARSLAINHAPLDRIWKATMLPGPAFLGLRTTTKDRFSQHTCRRDLRRPAARPRVSRIVPADAERRELQSGGGQGANRKGHRLPGRKVAIVKTPCRRDPTILDTFGNQYFARSTTGLSVRRELLVAGNP